MTIDDERWVGPDGVLELFRRASAQFADADFLPARHHLSSIYAEPMPDGSAKTYACFQFIGLRLLDHWGTYRDVAVPVQNGTDDGWRFAQAGDHGGVCAGLASGASASHLICRRTPAPTASVDEIVGAHRLE